MSLIFSLAVTLIYSFVDNLHQSVRLSFSVRQFQSGISPSVCRIISVRLDVFDFQSGSAIFKCMHNIISISPSVCLFQSGSFSPASVRPFVG